MNSTDPTAAARTDHSIRERHCVLHIPHSSLSIPDADRRDILLSDQDLARDLRRMTDAFTDELVSGALPLARRVRFPVSRLIVDPERFIDDGNEPMAGIGMGVIYERTCDGGVLRRSPDARTRQRLLDTYYTPHHAALTRAVRDALERHGECMVLDMHSFPSAPLPYELDQDPNRPDICIGTDSFHTPDAIRDTAREAFEREGLSVAVNRPFSGALVPMSVYHTDNRVLALMVEVNRRLYMNEEAGTKSAEFESMRSTLGRAFSAIVSQYGR